MTDTAKLIAQAREFVRARTGPWSSDRLLVELAAALEAAEAERDGLRGLLQTDERIEAENRRLQDALDFQGDEHLKRAVLAEAQRDTIAHAVETMRLWEPRTREHRDARQVAYALAEEIALAGVAPPEEQP